MNQLLKSQFTNRGLRGSHSWRQVSAVVLLAFAAATAPIARASMIDDEFEQRSPRAQQPRTSAPPAGAKPDLAKLAEQSLAAFSKGDYANAERLLREQIALDDRNFVPHYNLACALALQNMPRLAVDSLINAVQRGFVDLKQLKADPSLNPIRDTPEFAALISNWPTVLERHRDATAALAEKNFSHTATARDELLRLSFVSAFDERSFEQARAEISRIAQWGAHTVFPEILDPELAKNDPWVVVVLPNRKDFLSWIVAQFGPGAITSTNSIGGSYDHDAKRLVSQDLGSSLRHEFFHVLHWRDMTRRGQVHPIWIQEGLCSLVEDYDVAPAPKNEANTDQHGDPSTNPRSGPPSDTVPPGLVPATSWRTNIAKRLEKNNLLMPIEKLCGLSRGQFMMGRPLAMYAQARSLFLYLDQKKKLGEWYAAYCDGFEQDPTGVEALKLVLAMDMLALNKDYRAWVRALPAVSEEILPGKASVGLEIDAGSGEGPVVVSINPKAQITGEEGKSRRAILAGDVITAINNRPTREIAELVRVLGEFEPGQSVELSYRRGAKHGSAMIVLIAK